MKEGARFDAYSWLILGTGRNQGVVLRRVGEGDQRAAVRISRRRKIGCRVLPEQRQVRDMRPVAEGQRAARPLGVRRIAERQVLVVDEVGEVDRIVPVEPGDRAAKPALSLPSTRSRGAAYRLYRRVWPRW